MLKKSLMAMAIACALGFPAGAMAVSEDRQDAIDATPLAVQHGAPVIEIGDGMLATVVDDEFDSYAEMSEDTAVGATASAGASGEIAFSSEGGVSASANDESRAVSMKEQVYLVPAPLAQNIDSHYWKVELTPSGVAELDRLATENVYVAIPHDEVPDDLS